MKIRFSLMHTNDYSNADMKLFAGMDNFCMFRTGEQSDESSGLRP